ERRRVYDDAAADHRRDVRVEHARRHEVELEDLVAADARGAGGVARPVASDDRVAGVVAALVADDHRDLLGEEVGRLALALVAPLEPDDHGCGHQRRPRHAAAGANKKPRGRCPGTWVHISRVAPALRRRSLSKTRVRLTGRTTRLPRATADLLMRFRRCRGTARVYQPRRARAAPAAA